MLNAIYSRYQNATPDKKQFLLHAALAALFRALAASTAFLLNVAAARVLGAEQSGIFFLGLSIATLLATLCLVGMDNALLRFISYFDHQHNHTASNQVFSNAYVLVLPVSVTVAVAIYLLAPFLANVVFEKANSQQTIRYFSIAIPIVSMLLLNGYALQASRRIIAAICSMQLGINILMLVSLYGISYFYLYPPASTAALFYLGSVVIVAIIGLIQWFQPVGRKFDLNALNMPVLWQAIPSFWLISATGQAIPWASVIIVGFFASSENVAFFSVALRTSFLISFMLTVVNIVVAPRFSAYWHAEQYPKLKQLAQYSTRLMILLSVPILLIIFIWPNQIMMLFGAEFSQAATPLLILAVGQSVNLMTGSVGFLLTMCGHERDMRNITVSVGLTTLILLLLFTFFWGIIGAAIAVSFGAITQNLLAIFKVRSKLGFWPI